MTIGRCAFAAGLAATVGYALVTAETDLAARHAVAEALASHPGWQVAAITIQPWSGRMRLRGLRATLGPTSVAIGTLDLPLHRADFGLIPSAQAASPNAPPTPPPRPEASPAPPPPSADTATANDVVITSGTITYRIKHVGLTGTKLTDADLATLLDAKSAATPEARLKSLTAKAVEIPEIVGDDATAGSQRHWSATKLLFTDVVSGKAGAGSASAVALTLTQGGETVEGALEALQGTGLELPQLAHLLTSRTDDKERVLPIGETFGMAAMKLANAGRGTTVALASLKATAVSARPLRADHAVTGGTEAPASGTGLTDRPTLLEDLVHSFAAGVFEANDLVAAHKDATSNSSFAAKRFFLKDFRDGQGTGGLREALVEQADLHATVGSVDFDDLSTASPTGKGSRFKGMIAAGQIAVSTRPAPDDPVATPLAFKIEHLAIAGDADGPGDLPNDLALALDHMTFQTGSATATARTLSEMGYPRLDLSGALAARYDAATRTLAVDKLSIVGADMGTATLGLQLANAGSGLISPKAEVAQAARFALLMKSCDLRLENGGLVENALAWKAKNNGISVADERAQDVDFFARMLPETIGGPNARVLGEAIGAFIAAPRTLEVTATSKNGLGAADLRLLASPDMLLDSLDLHASANGQAAAAPAPGGAAR